MAVKIDLDALFSGMTPAQQAMLVRVAGDPKMLAALRNEETVSEIAERTTAEKNAERVLKAMNKSERSNYSELELQDQDETIESIVESADFLAECFEREFPVKFSKDGSAYRSVALITSQGTLTLRLA